MLQYEKIFAKKQMNVKIYSYIALGKNMWDVEPDRDNYEKGDSCKNV